jgi:hypothetical protein
VARLVTPRSVGVSGKATALLPWPRSVLFEELIFRISTLKFLCTSTFLA